MKIFRKYLIVLIFLFLSPLYGMDQEDSHPDSETEIEMKVVTIQVYDPHTKATNYVLPLPNRTVNPGDLIWVRFNHPKNGEFWYRDLEVVAVIRKPIE